MSVPYTRSGHEVVSGCPG